MRKYNKPNYRVRCAEFRFLACHLISEFWHAGLTVRLIIIVVLSISGVVMLGIEGSGTSGCKINPGLNTPPDGYAKKLTEKPAASDESEYEEKDENVLPPLQLRGVITGERSVAILEQDGVQTLFTKGAVIGKEWVVDDIQKDKVLLRRGEKRKALELTH